MWKVGSSKVKSLLSTGCVLFWRSDRHLDSSAGVESLARSRLRQISVRTERGIYYFDPFLLCCSLLFSRSLSVYIYFFNTVREPAAIMDLHFRLKQQTAPWCRNFIHTHTRTHTHNRREGHIWARSRMVSIVQRQLLATTFTWRQSSFENLFRLFSSTAPHQFKHTEYTL